ncbi:lipid A biosynthesis acyltransferase [Methylophaga frappieri]|nr:lipid A biosynthesis acyltransferase [Methylophaga frappieri]
MRLSALLPVMGQRFAGKVIGQMMWWFARDRADIAKRNLALCFPDLTPQQRHHLLHKTMQTMGMMPIETALSWWGSDEALAKRVDYHGLQHLQEALAKGKGVLLLTGHFTSMELGGRLILLKQPAYIMFRELKSPLFNAVMLKYRKYHSEGTILQADMRGMLRALRKNKVVWYAPDQDFGRRTSVFATFFGVKAATIPATARIAKMSGAAVVPYVPRRLANGRYQIDIGPALDNFPSDDELADAQRINDWVEQQVKLAPEQYLWVHRRFKTQPEGRGQLYK